MSGAGFNGNEALRSRVLMDVETRPGCTLRKNIVDTSATKKSKLNKKIQVQQICFPFVQHCKLYFQILK